jgi:hypothetical protein
MFVVMMAMNNIFAIIFVCREKARACVVGVRMFCSFIYSEAVFIFGFGVGAIHAWLNNARFACVQFLVFIWIFLLYLRQTS